MWGLGFRFAPYTDIDCMLCFMALVRFSCRIGLEMKASKHMTRRLTICLGLAELRPGQIKSIVFIIRRRLRTQDYPGINCYNLHLLHNSSAWTGWWAV